MFLIDPDNESDREGFIIWKGEEYEIPDMDQLERWVFDSVCEKPDGTRIEPDHPDSWLCILGLM